MRLRGAIAYTRVSTKKQGESGIGLEAQWQAIKACADRMGYQILERFSDTASGAGELSPEKRPGLQQAIRMAKESNLPVIVAGLDRLSRHTKTAEKLILQEGIQVISATEGSLHNPVTVSSRAAQAEHIRNEISRTTKEGLARAKQRGVKLGNPNLPEAQKLGAARNRARAEGKVAEIADALEELADWSTMSAVEIADFLNGKSIRTGRGKPWTLSAIRRPFAGAKKLIEQREAQKRFQELAKDYADNPLFGRF